MGNWELFCKSEVESSSRIPGQGVAAINNQSLVNPGAKCDSNRQLILFFNPGAKGDNNQQSSNLLNLGHKGDNNQSFFNPGTSGEVTTINNLKSFLILVRRAGNNLQLMLCQSWDNQSFVNPATKGANNKKVLGVRRREIFPKCKHCQQCLRILEGRTEL